MDSTPATAVGSPEAHMFGELEEGFRRARDRADLETERMRLTLGGGSVAVEVVGRRLFDRITLALAHLRVDAGARDPDLSVYLWDADATGVPGPPPAPGGDPTARAIASASNDGRYVLQRRCHAVVGQDRARSAVLGWFRDVDRLPLYDRGRPLHPQLLLWNQDRGAPPLHAGLVARAGRGALFVGEGGSGKTTSTLACLLHGFDFLGDDYVSLLEVRGAFVGHGVYGSTHVDPHHLARFPELHARAIHPFWENEDKAVVFLAGVLPERLARESPIDALFLPTVQSGPTSVRPATPAQALLRLVQGALALAPHAGSGAGMERLFGLAAAVPAFWLDLGADLDEIPAAVARTLDALPG